MQQAKPLFQDVLEEHRELRGMASDLRKFLEKPRPAVEDLTAHAWASGLAKSLVLFHDKVYRHFHDEESSGFLEEVCRVHPYAERPATTLLTEHAAILTDLRAVLDDAMVYAENKAPEQQNLRQRTLAVLDRFDAHEHEETGLFQRLMNRDLGTGD